MGFGHVNEVVDFQGLATFIQHGLETFERQDTVFIGSSVKDLRQAGEGYIIIGFEQLLVFRETLTLRLTVFVGSIV